MADPTGVAPYLLTNPDSSLTQSRTFAVAGGSGLDIADGGPGNNYVVDTINALNALNNISGTGYVVAINNISPYIHVRQMTSTGGSIAITNATGGAGNTNFEVVAGTSIQNINYYTDSVLTNTGPNINLIPGTGVDITGQFTGGIMNYTISSEGSGTVTSVGLSSTSGLAITGSPVTGSGVITVDLPIGTLNQVLKVTSVSPYTLGFSSDAGGTVTSVSVTTSSGLLITGSPITTTGAITVDLPTGTLNQVLAVTSVSPYTLGFVPQTSSSLATYFCQTSASLPTNGIDLSNAASKLGIGTATPSAPLNIVGSVSNISFLAEANTINTWQLSSYGNGGAEARLALTSARGSVGAPADLQSGDTIAFIKFQGYATSLFVTGTQIKSSATENFLPNSHGAKLEFTTCANGTNTQSTRMTIDQSGFVGIGTTTPSTLLNLFSATGASTFLSEANGLNNHEVRSYGSSFAAILMRHTSGTKAAPTATLSGQILGSLQYAGYGATTNGVSTVSISSAATENFTDVAQGSKLYFNTTPNGSITPATSMTIDQTGFVGIGTTTPESLLSLSSTTTATTLQSDANGINTIQVSGYGAGGVTSYPYLLMRAARGTKASPTAIQLNDYLGFIAGGGYGTSAFSNPNNLGGIGFLAAQNWTNTAQGSKITFSTTPNNTVGAGGAAMTIDQTGFVGIGTDTPAALLNIYSGVDATTLQIDSQGDNRVQISSYGTGNYPYVSGRAARGTLASPTATQMNDLLVTLEGYGYGSSTFGNAAGQAQFYAAQTFTDSAHGSYFTIKTTANNTTSAAERIRVDQNGSVGIGTDTPTELLTIGNTSNGNLLNIQGQGGTVTSMITSYGNSCRFWQRSSGGTKAAPTATTLNQALGQLTFQGWAGSTASGGFTNGAYMYCEATENWTSTGTAPGTANGTRLKFYTTANGSTTQALRMCIDQAGGTYLGGGTIPNYLLELGGDSAGKPTTNLWTISSDERIKTDIQDVPEALSIMNSLRPRTYKYSQDHVAYHDSLVEKGECTTNPYCTEKVHYGFVAQEVEQVMPSCVSVSTVCSGEHKDIKVFNAHNINVMMVKAIQELSAANAALVARIEALEAA